MIKYRINWRSKETGKEGNGEPRFSSPEAAEETAKTLNSTSPFLRHWIEAINIADDVVVSSGFTSRKSEESTPLS